LQGTWPRPALDTPPAGDLGSGQVTSVQVARL